MPLTLPATDFYRDNDVPLFPVERMGKAPEGRLVRNGVHGASLAPVWDHDGNWGVACGHRLKDGRYLAVLDIDSYKEGCVTHDLELPHTVGAVTPRRGQHLYYASREPVGSNDRVMGREGLELKGVGKYVVAVGGKTKHGEYVWDTGAHPDETDIADLPEWLYAAKPQPRPEIVAGDPANSTIGVAFATMGWLGVYSNGKRHCTCPWESEHTPGHSSPSSTVLLPVTATSNFGAFKCQHSHCTHRSAIEAFRMCSTEAQAAGRSAFATLRKVDHVSGEDDESPPAPPIVEQYFPVSSLVGKFTKDGFIATGAVANVLSLLSAGPWERKIAYDEMLECPALMSVGPHEERPSVVYPRDWTNSDDTLAAAWLQRSAYKLPIVSSTVTEGVDAIAKQNKFNRLTDYLNGLVHDGTPRVDHWLSTYLGAADTEYVSQVGRMWLISAVARAFEPGCQVDYVLVLEGSQRIGKSTALRILGGQYFSDDIGDVSTKDAPERLRGNWIIEIPEMAGILVRETSVVKGFITRRIDNYREAYGRRAGKFPRRSVLAGTVNEFTWLFDSTGGGRYWPTRVYIIDTVALAADRDQLWAEVVAMYRAGKLWYPATEEFRELAAAEAESRRGGDPWEPVLKEKLSGAVVTSADAFEALLIPAAQRDSRQQSRIARCLQVLGFSPGTDGTWTR